MGGVGINGVVGVNGGECGLMGLICSDIFCKRVDNGGPVCCQDLYVGAVWFNGGYVGFKYGGTGINEGY